MPSRRRADPLAWYGDVLEDHGAPEESPLDLTPYRGDPVRFATEFLGATLTEQQEELLRLVSQEVRVVCRSGNGLGKDYAMAIAALYHVFVDEGFCIVTGPGRRTVQGTLYDEVRAFFHAHPGLPGAALVDGLLIDARTRRWGLKVMTSAEANRLQGFHHARLLILVTEAQGVDESVYNAMDANARGEGNTIVAYGNPVTPACYFYRINQPASGWFVYKLDYRLHPNVTGSGLPIPGAVSQSGIDRVARQHGRRSAYYTWSVEGEFPEVDEEALFQRDWIEAARSPERWRDLHAELVDDPDLTIGFDVGRDNDLNVLVVRRGPVVLGIETRPGLGDLMSVVEWAVKRAEAWRNDRRTTPLGSAWPERVHFVVDASGLGAGVADRIREKGYTVTEFKAQNKAVLELYESCANARAAAFWNLREALRKDELFLPDDPLLIEELLAHRAKTHEKILVVDKDALRSALGRSPDRADALAMCFYRRVTGGVRYGGALVPM
jgi:hypothetical protein